MSTRPSSRLGQWYWEWQGHQLTWTASAKVNQAPALGNLLHSGKITRWSTAWLLRSFGLREWRTLDARVCRQSASCMGNGLDLGSVCLFAGTGRWRFPVLPPAPQWRRLTSYIAAAERSATVLDLAGAALAGLARGMLPGPKRRMQRALDNPIHEFHITWKETHHGSDFTYCERCLARRFAWR